MDDPPLYPIRRSFASFRICGVSINNILRRRAMNAGVTVGGKNTIHEIEEWLRQK